MMLFECAIRFALATLVLVGLVGLSNIAHIRGKLTSN